MQELERTLRLPDLYLIVVGTVIGSGIFIVPAFVLRFTGGSVELSLLVWIIGGVLSLVGALTYAELGAMNPQAGGLYIYLRDSFGPFVAFLYGWMLFFIAGNGSVATLATAFSSYASQFYPLDPFLTKVVAVGMVVTVSLINILGTRKSVHVQNWSTGIKVGAIILVSLLLIATGKEHPGIVEVPRINLEVLAGIGGAMIGVLWAYDGWHYVTFSAGETINPRKVFARGLAGGTATIVVIYLLANVAYVSALGPDLAATSERVAADAVSTVLGTISGKLITAAILVSMFSAANGVILTSTRVYYAMANDGVFFKALARIHPRFKTPAFAVFASMLWALVLTMSGTFEQLLTYVIFASWTFYALGAICVLIMRRRLPEVERPFRVPGYPITPLLFVVTTGIIMINTLVTQPTEALVGLAIVLIGTPAFMLWKRRSSPR